MSKTLGRVGTQSSDADGNDDASLFSLVCESESESDVALLSPKDCIHVFSDDVGEVFVSGEVKWSVSTCTLDSALELDFSSTTEHGEMAPGVLKDPVAPFSDRSISVLASKCLVCFLFRLDRR